jgi:hypothetical protein
MDDALTGRQIVKLEKVLELIKVTIKMAGMIYVDLFCVDFPMPTTKLHEQTRTWSL